MVGTLIRKPDRPGGRWYVRVFYDGRPRDIAAKTTDRRLAAALLKRLEAQKVVGHGGPTQTPLDSCIEAFVAHMQFTKRDGSVKREVSRLRRLFGDITPAIEARQRHALPAPRTRLAREHVEQISSALIQQVLDERGRQASPQTVNHDRAIIARLFAFARDRFAMRHPEAAAAPDQNPVLKSQRRRVRVAPIRFLTRPQIEEQLRAFDRLTRAGLIKPYIGRTLRMAVAVYIFADLRREEACWLALEDIDTLSGWVRVRAKTDPESGETWHTKTGKDRRVPLSPPLRSELARYLKTGTPKRWLLETKRGCRWHPDNLSARLRHANSLAHLPWTTLDYRHTFGSHLAQMGYSPQEIADYMGNSVQIVMRHYASMLSDERRRNVDFMRKRRAM